MFTHNSYQSKTAYMKKITGTLRNVNAAVVFCLVGNLHLCAQIFNVLPQQFNQWSG